MADVRTEDKVVAWGDGESTCVACGTKLLFREKREGSEFCTRCLKAALDVIGASHVCEDDRPRIGG